MILLFFYALQQTVQAEINHTGYQGPADTQSTVSDWEVTSVDRWNTQSSRGTKSVSSSMQNYLESGSIENQSIQSQLIEQLDDSDQRTRLPSDTDQTLKEDIDARKLFLTASNVEEENMESVKNEHEESVNSSEVLIDFGNTDQNDQSENRTMDS